MITDEDASKFRKGLASYVEEAYNYRYNIEGPSPGEGIAEMLAKLMDARKRMDRVEEILFKTIRIRANIRRVSEGVQANADDAWDQAVQQTRASSVVRGPDMVGPRERYADANLATLSERREARRVAELASYADEAVEVIKLALRGLDSLRQDLSTAFRALQFESSLER